MTYSPSHGNDQVSIDLTGTWTAAGLSGKWTLYEVVDETKYDGSATTGYFSVASGSYTTSGQDVNTTVNTNGSLNVVENVGGLSHASYHYELTDNVVDAQGNVYATITKDSTEQADF